MRLLLLIVFALLTGSAFASPPSGYKIRVKINGYSHSSLVLGYYLGNKTYSKDTARISNDGYFTFTGKDNLPDGIYLVVMQPNNQFFQLLVNEKNQQFSCETSQKNPEGDMRIKGSADNTNLYEYINYLDGKSKEAESLRNSIKSKQGDTIAAKNRLAQMDEEIVEHQNKLINKYPNSLFATVIRAQQPAEKKLPDFDGNDDEQKRLQFRWAHERWFNHLSFTNPFFIRTSFFLPRVNDYLDRMTAQDPDSIIIAVDFMLKRAEPSNEMFKFLTVELLNRFAASRIMGFDKVYVHLVEKYYKPGRANWVDAEQRQKIIDNAAALSPILIGKEAPNLRLETTDGLAFDLNAFKSNYTLLFFWTLNSSSSMRQLNELKTVASKYRAKGLRVVTVCTGTEPMPREQWINTLEQQQLDAFLNTFDTNPSESGTKLYFLRQFPQLFLLDSRKRIQYKQISVEQVQDILERLVN